MIYFHFWGWRTETKITSKIDQELQGLNPCIIPALQSVEALKLFLGRIMLMLVPESDKPYQTTMRGS